MQMLFCDDMVNGNTTTEETIPYFYFEETDNFHSTLPVHTSLYWSFTSNPSKIQK